MNRRSTSRRGFGRWAVGLALAGLLFSLPAAAFEVSSEQTSYLHRRSLLFNFELGAADLIHTRGLEGRLGFGFRLGCAYPFSDSLAVDIQYQFNPLWLRSPNPIDTSRTINSHMYFNQGYSRLIYTYARYAWQPYLFGGVGVYSMLGVDGRTAFSFPANLEFPFGAGLNWYLSGNRLMLRSEFTYHWLRGEQQSRAVLNVLNVKDIAFDVYSAWLGLVWAFY